MPQRSDEAVNGPQTRVRPPLALVAPREATVDSMPSVTNNVVRTRLLALLERRWDHAVTTVVAGAGFGKSIAIGQSMRANQLQARGVEARISCRSGCEDADRLAATIRRALGADGPAHGAPLAQVQAAIADHAPLPTSLVLDDAEELTGASAALLDRLVRSAPTNLRLVLVGRSLPALSLARLRAADQVLEIGAAELRFDDAEIAALATSLGTPPPADRFGGWPAVVRLSLAAPGRAAGDYLWEEVIGGLEPADRGVLQALCALGEATPDEVGQVTGHLFDTEAFCRRVPLVHRVGSRLVAHDLWLPFLADLGADGSVQAVADRALAVVAARGDAVATGQLALRLGDRAALRRAAVDLVRTTLGSLPADVAEAWLAVGDDGPEHELLACALAHTRTASEPPAARLDALGAAFAERAEPEGEAVVIALGALVADAGRDLGRLLALSMRAQAIAQGHRDPILDLLVDCVGAAMSALQGDLDGALALLDRPRPDLPPNVRPEALTRLHWRLLLLAGRAADAARLADSFEPAPELSTERPLETVARWLAGDPDGLDPEAFDVGPGRYGSLPERDQFDQAAFVAVLAAAFGRTDALDVAVEVLTSSPFAATTGPDGAFLAVALACQRILDHDDAGAAAEIERFLAAGPADGLVDAHLRRFLAVPYVGVGSLREAWDRADLGPSQQLARTVASALVDARAGRCPATEQAPAATICTALPLPWAVELAARAAAAGRCWGTDLALDLVRRFGEPATAEVARRARDIGSDRTVAHGAGLLRASLPVAPPGTVEIRVIGPLEIRRDGQVVDAPELRRGRVRELLSLLAVERSVSRDRAIELLWPDHDPAKGRANLRVTLAHLQRLLEPERSTGEPTYFVQASPTRLALPTVPGLDVDLWTVEHGLAESDRARLRGDAPERVRHLRDAVDRWRGRPLTDLERLPELEPAGSHLALRLLDATLTLGELELVGGDVGRATRCAELSIAADPYDERAHRLAVAAALHAGDRSGTAIAIARLHQALDDLGVGPAEATQMLLRQADPWLGVRLVPAGAGTAPG